MKPQATSTAAVLLHRHTEPELSSVVEPEPELSPEHLWSIWSLVLERVDEDDVLCAALVCTMFRDGLFAQPRHRMRVVGHAYTYEYIAVRRGRAR
eukprot:COSAG06_NODE_3310_length_5519_cov_2.364374_3_plen_95_part_00